MDSWEELLPEHKAPRSQLATWAIIMALAQALEGQTIKLQI